jgi:SH3-like domain-containing protein
MCEDKGLHRSLRGAAEPIVTHDFFPARGPMNSKRSLQIVRRAWVTALSLIAALACAAPARAAGEFGTGPKSGLPIPRFVSLKPDRVNVRGGPTRDHEVTFVYTRSGLPVEITAESDNWRRIRDWEGSEGWVYHSLLSGRRTAVVMPKYKTELLPLYDKGDSSGTVIARLQAGVLAVVKRCTGSWCRIAGSGFDGWAVQEQLWGVYPNEKVE